MVLSGDASAGWWESPGADALSLEVVAPIHSSPPHLSSDTCVFFIYVDREWVLLSLKQYSEWFPNISKIPYKLFKLSKDEGMA